MARAMFSAGFGFFVVAIISYILGVQEGTLYFCLGISGASFLGSIAAKYLNL